MALPRNATSESKHKACFGLNMSNKQIQERLGTDPKQIRRQHCNLQLNLKKALEDRRRLANLAGGPKQEKDRCLWFWTKKTKENAGDEVQEILRRST